jgi:hypothetical protein
MRGVVAELALEVRRDLPAHAAEVVVVPTGVAAHAGTGHELAGGPIRELGDRTVDVLTHDAAGTVAIERRDVPNTVDLVGDGQHAPAVIANPAADETWRGEHRGVAIGIAFQLDDGAGRQLPGGDEAVGGLGASGDAGPIGRHGFDVRRQIGPELGELRNGRPVGPRVDVRGALVPTGPVVLGVDRAAELVGDRRQLVERVVAVRHRAAGVVEELGDASTAVVGVAQCDAARIGRGDHPAALVVGEGRGPPGGIGQGAQPAPRVVLERPRVVADRDRRGVAAHVVAVELLTAGRRDPPGDAPVDVVLELPPARTGVDPGHPTRGVVAVLDPLTTLGDRGDATGGRVTDVAVLATG